MQTSIGPIRTSPDLLLHSDYLWFLLITHSYLVIASIITHPIHSDLITKRSYTDTKPSDPFTITYYLVCLFTLVLTSLGF